MSYPGLWSVNSWKEYNLSDRYRNHKIKAYLDLFLF